MAKATIVTYECKKCGSEIVVKETGESALATIYCCGVAVAEVTSAERKQTKPKKKTAKTVKKKMVKKKVTKAKKILTKKK